MSPTTHTAVSLLEPFGGHVKIQRVDCADISLYLQATVPDPHWGLPFSCKQPRLALMAAASLVISYSSESWLSRRRNGLLCRRLQCCVDWEQYTNWTNVLLRSFFAWTYQNIRIILLTEFSVQLCEGTSKTPTQDWSTCRQPQDGARHRATPNWRRQARPVSNEDSRHVLTLFRSYTSVRRETTMQEHRHVE